MLMQTQTLEPAGAGAATRDAWSDQLPLLMRHTLLDPPRNGRRDPGEVKVWRPARQTLDGGDTLLTMRYLAVQTMQVRLDMLFGASLGLGNPVLDAFIRGRFDHVYLDAASFTRFASLAPEVRGNPASLPAYLDVAANRLVIDASRFFDPGKSRVTAAARAAIVEVTESPRFARCIGEHLLPVDAAAVHPLLESAREIARYVVAEVAPSLSQPARDLAQRAGAKLVMRALLAGSTADVHAVMTAFEPRWRELQPHSQPTRS